MATHPYTNPVHDWNLFSSECGAVSPALPSPAGRAEVSVLGTEGFGGVKGSPCWVYHSEGQKLFHRAAVQSPASAAVGTPASLLKQGNLHVRRYAGHTACPARH